MTFANRLKAAENLPVLSTKTFPSGSRLTFGLEARFCRTQRAAGRLADAHVSRFVWRPIWKFRSHPSRRASRFEGAVQEPRPHYGHAASDGRVGSDRLVVSLHCCAGHGQTGASQIQRIWSALRKALGKD